MFYTHLLNLSVFSFVSTIESSKQSKRPKKNMKAESEDNNDECTRKFVGEWKYTSTTCAGSYFVTIKCDDNVHGPCSYIEEHVSII